METSKGILKFEMEGVTNEQTHRYREMIDLILTEGVLNVKNGKVILSFNHEGLLSEIEFQVKKYRRKSSSTIPG